MFKKKASAEDDDAAEEVALVEIKAHMLVCKGCKLRVHWRCYQTPYIKTQLRNWRCRWCTYVLEQQQEKNRNADEARVEDLTSEPAKGKKKTEEEIEKEWLNAWYVASLLNIWYTQNPRVSACL